jgi:putative addiction module component (TIGR02574 family)
MATIDFSHMTPAEKLDLIGELWDSLDHDTVPLTEAQAAELARRLATLDEDIEQGEDAFAIYDELTARYR